MHHKEHKHNNKRLVGGSYHRIAKPTYSSAEPALQHTAEQSKPTKGFMKGHKTYDSVREKVMNGTDTAPSQVTGKTKSKVSPGLA
jgi:hypothetical protein